MSIATVLDTIAAATATCAIGVITHGVFSPRSHLFSPVVAQTQAANGVTLTFDDGPWPGSTDLILDSLKEAQVSAAFFVIGRYAAAHRDLVRRMHTEGHIVANHTFDHDRAGLFKGYRYWTDQIARTDDVIHDIIGRRPKFFRPPMGFKSSALARAAAHHSIIAWTRRGYDGVVTDPDLIVRRASGARAKDIIVLHDGRDPASSRPLGATAQAVPRLIESLRRSFSILPLEKALALPAYA